MIPPTHTLVRCLLAAANLTIPCMARQLTWESIMGDGGSGESSLVATEALPSDSPDGVAFSAINFTGDLLLPGISGILGLDHSGAAVLKSSDAPDGSRRTDWTARLRSAAGVELTDLSISPESGEILVCGTSVGPIELLDANVNPLLPVLPLSPGAQPRGFVARLDPATGKWIRSFNLEAIRPRSLTTSANGTIVIGGEGALAAAYHPTGELLWKSPQAAETGTTSHVARLSDNSIAVLCQASAPGGKLSLAALSTTDGSTLWSTPLGVDGTNRAGGLGVAADGDIRVAFATATADGRNSAHLARLKRDGTPVWQVELGRAATGSSVTIGDLDIDPVGNTWVGAHLDGEWNFPDADPVTFANNAALVAIDGNGNFYDLHRSSAGSGQSVAAVCAALPERVILGGRTDGPGDSLFGALPLLTSGEGPALFLATVGEIADQNLYIFRDDPEIPGLVDPALLLRILKGLGVRIHLLIDRDAGQGAVTGYATLPQIASILRIGGIIAERETELASNGAAHGTVFTASDAGWALARLSNASDTSSDRAASYDYVESDSDVRLYLIDTAVTHIDHLTGPGTKMEFEGTTLVRGHGDPTTSSNFEHGTKVLSLVGGPKAGAARGVPVRVINYDIYPSGRTTTSGLLASAIYKAVDDFEMNESDTSPAVICIASGSTAPDDSPIVRNALSYAIEIGMTVVVSAGNAGASASEYVPSRYGTEPGLICAGASGRSNRRIGSSNHGPAVDLFAPGETVRTIHFDNPAGTDHGQMTGTSASAGLAAAAALIELSIEPGQTPADVEDAMKRIAFNDEVPIIQTTLRSPAPDTLSDEVSLVTATTDTDSDGIPDLVERFHGSADADAVSRPDPIHLQLSDDDLTAAFTVDRSRFDPLDPYRLTDGTEWRVLCSRDLSEWIPADGTLRATPADDKRIDVSFTFTTDDPACFIRIEIVPPSR